VIEQCEQKDIDICTPHFVVQEGTKNRVVGSFVGLNQISQRVVDETTNVDLIRGWCCKWSHVGKIDLTAAFHNVPVNNNTKRLLGFRLGNKTYRYLRMPMGVSAGPAVFHKWLQSKLSTFFGGACGNVVHYQDDIFVGALSAADRNGWMERLVEFAASCGLKNGTVSLPADKREKLGAWINAVESEGCCTKRRVYQILGLINFFRSFSVSVSSCCQYLYTATRSATCWTEVVKLDSGSILALKSLLASMSEWSLSTQVVDGVRCFIDASRWGYGAFGVFDFGILPKCSSRFRENI